MAFKPLIATLLLAVLVAAGCGSPTPTKTATATTVVTVTAPQQSQSSTAHTTTATAFPSPTQDDPSNLDPATYQAISARDFAVLVKDPDSARGRKIVVYGSVEQADAATGNKFFRATVMGKPHADHVYQIDSVITSNDPSIIRNVVEGDQVTMYVEVAGTFTYQTQLGGKTTAPLFRANIINVTAHIDR